MSHCFMEILDAAVPKTLLDENGSLDSGYLNKSFSVSGETLTKLKTDWAAFRRFTTDFWQWIGSIIEVGQLVS